MSKNQLGSLLTPALTAGLGPAGIIASPLINTILSAFQFDNPNNDSNLMKEYTNSKLVGIDYGLSHKIMKIMYPIKELANIIIGYINVTFSVSY